MFFPVSDLRLAIYHLCNFGFPLSYLALMLGPTKRAFFPCVRVTKVEPLNVRERPKIDEEMSSKDC